jgi:signal transduction histidine kinase
VVVSLRDVTERRVAEDEIRQNQTQLRSLALALAMAEEKERRQLATRLHDSVGQMLAVSNMRLGELLTKVPSGEMADMVREIRELTRETIETTRSLTFDLSPPILYGVGLTAAVQWLGDRLSAKHDIGFKLYTFPRCGRVDEQTRVLVFQIIRELLFNVVKHASAANVQVYLAGNQDSIHVAIEDDGIGFDTRLITQRRDDAPGFGLFSIQERLNHIGGELAVHSGAGQGTVVSFFVPLKESDDEQESMGARPLPRTAAAGKGLR